MNSVKPPRIWRPMIMWTAGILVVLGLAWFIGAVAVPYYQVRAVFKLRALDVDGFFYEEGVRVLGGPERALPKIRVYLRFPSKLAPCRRGSSGSGLE